MPEDDLFSYAEAKAARDEGMERVRLNSGDWWIKMKDAVRAIPVGWEGTSEDMRLFMLRQGLPHPPGHHNIWGSVTTWALQQGLIEFVRWGRMKTVKSHARRTPIYRRTSIQGRMQ